jgi:hypothetical protein
MPRWISCSMGWSILVLISSKVINCINKIWMTSSCYEKKIYLTVKGLLWPWLFGSWIYNYLCNKCLSPLMLWVRISIRVRCTTLCDKVCQWFTTDQWFSLGPPVLSTNKTGRHNIKYIVESGKKHHKTKPKPNYLTMMINNCTNINNHLLPQIVVRQKDHGIWPWKSRYWLGTCIKFVRINKSFDTKISPNAEMVLHNNISNNIKLQGTYIVYNQLLLNNN